MGVSMFLIKKNYFKFYEHKFFQLHKLLEVKHVLGR